MYYPIESPSGFISLREYPVNYGFDFLSHIKLRTAKALSTTNLSSLLILFLGLFFFPTVVLPAQSPDLGRPMATHEAKAGTLLVRGDDQDPFRPVPMVGTEVEIKVTGMIARAVVTQHFKNPTGEWLEGVYVFPLPDTAAVDTLSMKVGERIIVGEIKERAEAKKIYNKAKSQGKKASLLEQERPNIFTTSVANIGPGEVIEITIEYQEVMRYDKGGFSLRFPTVVAPRYIPGTRKVSQFSGTGWAQNTDEVVDASRVTPPVLNPDQDTWHGYRPTVRIQAQINAGFPVNVESLSHDVRVTHTKDIASVQLKDEVILADRDFVLEWQPQVGNAPDAALFTDVVDGQTYALIMVMPPTDTVSEDLKPLPREVIYVIDTSGSMDGHSIQQAKAALQLALTRLSPHDYFEVIQFNSYVEPLFNSSQPATPRNIRRAVDRIKRMGAEGGTEMLPALSLALRNGGTSDRVRQVIFITDGSVANEVGILAFVRQHIGQSRLFTVGIGSAPNAYFMRKVAELGRGTFTYIGKISEVKHKMGELFSKLESPVLSKITVDWKTRGVEHYPERIPDLYAGEPVLIAARLPRLGGNAEISGWRGAKPWAVDFKLAGGRSQSGVDRLYARKKIERLMLSLSDGASQDSVRKKIVEVGIAYHLVTKHTSLVAVEQVVSRPKDKKLKTKPVPVNLPFGWIYDSVFRDGGLGISKERYAEMNRKLADRISHSHVESKRRKEEERYVLAEEEKSLRLNAESLKSQKDLAKIKSTSGPLTIRIPTEHQTAQPTAVAKLQENAGIIPRAATPAALCLILGLGLLAVAGFLQMRKSRV